MQILCSSAITPVLCFFLFVATTILQNTVVNLKDEDNSDYKYSVNISGIEGLLLTIITIIVLIITPIINVLFALMYSTSTIMSVLKESR